MSEIIVEKWLTFTLVDGPVGYPALGG